LLAGFSVNRVLNDYGYDLIMATYATTGEIEPGVVYFQVKATARLPLLARVPSISWPVSRRDLKLWFAEAYPVILVVYDGDSGKAYWLHIQEIASNIPPTHLFVGGETIQMYVPLANRLNKRAIQTIARRKNDLHRHLRGRGSQNV